MRKVQRIAAVFASLQCAAGGALAQAPEAHRLELGVRYWMSTGQTRSSHDASGVDPILGNPTSTLSYDKLAAHTAELYARKALGERWFVKGNAGIGTITHGRLVDQDFATSQALIFETTSGLDGKLYYGTIDFGREVAKSGNSTFGLFAGYQYWNERLNAYGASNSGDPFFVFTALPGNTVPVISNEQMWDSARLGAEMRSVRGRTRFQAEVALIPYARYRNEDSHWLRQDTLGPAPNVIATGQGRGAQFEFEVRRTFPDLFDLEFGLGYRYWKMESTKGTMTFGGGSFPVVDLMSERHGVTFSVTKAW